MKRIVQLASVSLLMCAVCIALTNSSSAGGKDDMPVKLKATAGKIEQDGRQTVTVTMEIEDGWYAYANPVKNDIIDSNKTVVKIASGQKLEKVEITYPSGKKKIDDKESYMIYEGKVEITGTVKRAAGDTGPLDVTVKYNVCHGKKGICLPPEQVKLQVK